LTPLPARQSATRARALLLQRAQIAAARRIMADKTPCNLTQDEMRQIGAQLMEREE
jgi:hypothetical protein